MKRYIKIISLPLILLVFMACMQATKKEGIALAENANPPQEKLSLTDTSLKKVVKTNAEWKKELTADQYHILREKGTEYPFRNAFFDNHKKGH